MYVFHNLQLINFCGPIIQSIYVKMWFTIFVNDLWMNNIYISHVIYHIQYLTILKYSGFPRSGFTWTKIFLIFILWEILFLSIKNREIVFPLSESIYNVQFAQKINNLKVTQKAAFRALNSDIFLRRCVYLDSDNHDSSRMESCDWWKK